MKNAAANLMGQEGGSFYLLAYLLPFDPSSSVQL